MPLLDTRQGKSLWERLLQIEIYKYYSLLLKGKEKIYEQTKKKIAEVEVNGVEFGKTRKNAR